MKSLISFAFAMAISLFAVSKPAAAHDFNYGLQDTLDLPDGFQPEGITVAPRGSLFVGSIATGSIYRVNPRTGSGSVFVPAMEGRSALGMKWDRRTNNLYVAGGPTGKVFVYNAITGAEVAVLEATNSPATLVNDVVVTRRAVYITDSFRPVVYRLPLGHSGRLAPDAAIEEIPLSGDYQHLDGQFNSNGIEARYFGGSLVIVHTTLGVLYKVDPDTGVAEEIDLGGADLSFGDGILFVGCKLYVVQNFFNQIAEVSLSRDFTSGEVTHVLTSDGFDIPATIAAVGHSLYAANARFATPPEPDTPYTAVRVSLP